MVTSSGMRSPSIRERTKSKSVWEAEGKPTSISLKPIFTSRSKKRCLRSWSMGSISDWLPSRRSTLVQIGGCSMRRLGHWRSGRSTRSEEHTSELQSRPHLVCRLLLEKKKEENNERYKDTR